MSDTYEVIIVGAGPAGFAAGLYTTRDRFKTLVLEKSRLPGGQILLTERVENYPGIEIITGPDLVDAMRKQVEKFGGEMRVGSEVTRISRRREGLVELEITGPDGQYKLESRAVVLAPGSDYRRLGVPGEDQMRQATKVSYCATCDGAFYRDKEVLTVGGGNTAVEDSIYLAERFTKKLTLVHRRTEFRAQQVLVEELREKAVKHNIEIKVPYVLEEIVPNTDGSEIDHVVLRHATSGLCEQVKADGVFIFAGMVPNTGWLKGAVDLSEEGYLKCDPLTLRTSMPGVFVAGDCRVGAAMQLATACADGVIAAMMIKRYFRAPVSWAQETAEKLGGTGW